MKLKNSFKVSLILITFSALVSTPYLVNIFATSYGSDDIDCNTHHNSMGGINHMGGICEGEDGGIVHFGGSHNTNTGSYHFHSGFYPR